MIIHHSDRERKERERERERQMVKGAVRNSIRPLSGHEGGGSSSSFSFSPFSFACDCAWALSYGASVLIPV